MAKHQSSTQQTASYSGLTKEQRIARAAKALYGAYRIDQFTDPDGFIVQCAAVFDCETYTVEAVEYLCNPVHARALQCVHKWPPTIAEIREALDDEMERRARIMDASHKPRLHHYSYTKPPTHHGARANLLLRSDHPLYEAVRHWAASDHADPADWCEDPHGIRIGLHIWEDFVFKKPVGNWKPLSNDDLLALYGRREAAAAKENADG